MRPSNQSVSRGIFDMILASLSFGTMTAFVKLASETLPAFEIVFCRSLLGSLMMTALLLKEKGSFVGTQPKLLIMRGAFGFIALAMNFYAISKLNLGTAVILNYTSPIFVAIIAALLLKEEVSKILWVLTGLCFTGLFLLVGPQFSIKSFPILIGLFSGVMAALAYMTIRMAGKEESSTTIIFYFTTVATIGSLPLLRFGFHMPDAKEWFALLGIAITSFFGQIFLTRSIREAPASIVCPFSYLAPVFSFGFGVLIWKDPLTLGMGIGAALVILSGSLIYLFERRPHPISD